MLTMRTAAAAAAATALISLAAPAVAHVTARPDEATAGAYFQTAFNVGHGCDGSATVAVRVKMPEGVLSVKPQMKPGWTVEIKKRTLAAPQPSLHGKTITETVDEISWRGGPLPDSMYDTFGVNMKLPDTPGQTLYFPVVQECEKGANRWIEIPAAGEGAEKLHEPAPGVRLKPKAP
ncbi:YcnI family protein [Rhodopseudomonas sp. P2A-2r]|uniref:YcnI family protein n=1 Tax=unclassified Rhodopseudomonas TaxID=2638247 RepID=UPI0022342CA2|nr:YcnI family protein [Rhodopseudomonas sp. P2A-2r]UZE49035.1 YcnI family protein [Rhodopseudomonas sp. P2A-2r]